MPISLRSLTCVLVLCPALTAFADDSAYRLPPQDIVQIVDAAPTPRLQLSPDGRHFLLVERDAMPTIDDLSRRMLRLAGMRIDPGADGRYLTQFDRRLSMSTLDGQKQTSIPLPEGARLVSASWSPDSQHIVFAAINGGETELWTASVADPGNPRRLTGDVNWVMGGATWMPDSRRVVVRLNPRDRGQEPVARGVPTGPRVQETQGGATPLRTYQDLLTSSHDADLFDYYATTDLAIIDVVDGGIQRLDAPPAIYSDVEPSPDGHRLLLTTIERPYSYLMPTSRFPQTMRVHDLRSGEDTVIAQIPLGEDIPLHGVRTGPRSVNWRPGEPATLVWVEALDGGDPKTEVPHRDRWMSHAAPFKEAATEMFRIEHRGWGLDYLDDPSMVVSNQYDRDRRWMRAQLHDISVPGSTPQVLDDRSIRDRYADPGRLVKMDDGRGWNVVRTNGDYVYRSGTGASPQGLRPFLDRQNLKTMETERLWQSADDAYETVVDVLDGPGEELVFVTRYETKTDAPNYRLHRSGREAPVELTDFPDPTPQLRGIHKELVTYERDDGVQLSATLYLPADYEEGTRLPLIVWAYPIEFNDPSTAGQVTTSPNRFTRISGYSHLNLLTQGYAIMDGATMPIIGDPETMNDTFVNQLVSSAEAAINKAVEMGVADPDRVAVGGHSYGAFMTANLLAHCDLFRAGIARSGAYNRTLTPFGFQSERRTFWEAPDAYFNISPFMHAHKINEPILLIHGAADNNSGTFPMQSERLFQAIKGNGGTARLVMLPYESHGYRARESVMHVLAETVDWLDEYVKNAPPATASADEGRMEGE